MSKSLHFLGSPAAGVLQAPGFPQGHWLRRGWERAWGGGRYRHSGKVVALGSSGAAVGRV